MEQLRNKVYEVGSVYTATAPNKGEMKLPSENKAFNPMYANERTLEQLGIHIRKGLVDLGLKPTDNLINNFDILMKEILVIKKAVNNIATELKTRGLLNE